MQQRLVLPDQQSNRHHEESVAILLELVCKEPEHVPTREANAAVLIAAFSFATGLAETESPEIGEEQVFVA